MAYSRAAGDLVWGLLDDLDYVEYPYELLACNAEAATRADSSTGLLHSASLSLASGHPRDVAVVHAIAEWAERIDTPWIGEHLAFIDAEVPCTSAAGARGRRGTSYDIGFAVSPPLNARTVEIVATALTAAGSVTDRPFAIENSPIYLPMPGSTMGQGEAFTQLAQLVDIRLLMDLAHLLITCDTFGFDPLTELHRFPLDRVVEVHLSGVSRDSGVLWDDHASAPAAAQYDLLRALLDNAPVRAITHEYNWAPVFARDCARREIDQTRRILDSKR